MKACDRSYGAMREASATLQTLATHAPPWVTTQGRDWYPTARRQCQSLASETGLDIYTAAAIVAAVSPQMPWHLNIACAANVILNGHDAHGPGPLTTANRNLAVAIRDTRNPSLLTGHKRTAFYQNLIGSYAAVTVDVWAARAVGLESTFNGSSRADYQHVASIYLHAADRLLVPPATLQAIAWVAARDWLALPKHCTLPMVARAILEARLAL